MTVHFEAPGVVLHHGDCIEVMRTLPDNSVDAVVTDPPYGLEFMGKGWDGADGFRRSLNEADAGRESVFGRTSKTSPEYNTGRGARVRAERSSEVTERGKGHSTSAGPYLASGVDSTRVAGLPFQEWCFVWATEALRILKPGGHMLAFGGSRTWHRLTVAVEDAGFEIRDSIAWLYGSGFPKSLDVSKAIDAAAGAKRPTYERPAFGGTFSDDNGTTYGTAIDGTPLTDAAREWDGWGTALKPAFEPIVVGRKPLAGTVAKNVLNHGTGALNIDATRTAFQSDADRAESVTKNQHAKFGTEAGGNNVYGDYSQTEVKDYDGSKGRWPTNVLIEGTQAAELDLQTGVSRSRIGKPRGAASGDGWGMTATGAEYNDEGGASRFFPTFHYEAKAPSSERPDVDGVMHPTVKPLDLMRWLVRLVTPPDGTILEPFAGSGTTLEAALLEGFNVIGIEREADYLPLIEQRITKPLQPTMFGDWDAA